MHLEFANLIGYSVLFLTFASITLEVSRRYKLPYVVLLLLFGFLAQGIFQLMGFNNQFALDQEVIFFLLLPLLLFGGALHINFHQFKLQFKTITFLASFGLVISVLVTGFLMNLVFSWPLEVGLLFGAIISSTDPIAVLAIFKSLGAPRRLSLIADGESMFNDATGVIAFRVMLALVMGSINPSIFQLGKTILEFGIVFVGSIIVGAVLGLMISLVIERIKDDFFIETTLTIAAALGIFYFSEHYLHLSGVIATVVGGIVVGNLGSTKISGGVAHFIDEFWEYLSVLSIAVVFFFAALTINVQLIWAEISTLALIVIIVLIARSISVYSSFFITNKSRLFKNEPNVPLPWQHVINWGGMRGVIPLVLAFSLPHDFIYKEDMLLYTLGALVFSLIINGLTIEKLLVYLGLSIPDKSEQIQSLQKSIKELGKIQKLLTLMPNIKSEKQILIPLKEKMQARILALRKTLSQINSYEELVNSLTYQAISLERRTAKKMYLNNIIFETVYFDIDAELDLQQDALEYPHLYQARQIGEGGTIYSHGSFRKTLRSIRQLTYRWPFFKYIFFISGDRIVLERYMLVKARLAGNLAVIKNLDELQDIFVTSVAKKAVQTVRSHYQKYENKNRQELSEIVSDYQRLITRYHTRVMAKFARI